LSTTGIRLGLYFNCLEIIVYHILYAVADADAEYSTTFLATAQLHVASIAQTLKSLL
jgi:hypothetical protein